MRRTKIPTSFGVWESVMQMEHNFVNEEMDVSVVGTTDKQLPVMSESFWCPFVSNRRLVTNFEYHFNILEKRKQNNKDRLEQLAGRPSLSHGGSGLFTTDCAVHRFRVAHVHAH